MNTLTRSGSTLTKPRPQAPVRPEFSPPRDYTSTLLPRETESPRGLAHRTNRSTRPGSVLPPRGKVYEPRNTDRKLVAFWMSFLIILFGGVGTVMWVAATNTNQTFTVSTLRGQNTVLDNQLEVLRRDTRAATSTADISRRAQKLGMVVADAPGVISVDPAGVQHVLKEPDPSKTRPLLSLDDQRIRAQAASTNPADTAQLPAAGHNMPPVPAAALPAIAPYEPNVRSHGAGGAGE